MFFLKQKRTIRTEFVIALLAFAVPAVLFGGLMALRYADSERRVIAAMRADVARNAADVIDMEIASIQTGLTILGQSTTVDTEREKFPPLALLAKEKLTLSEVLVVNKAGQIVASTERQSAGEMFKYFAKVKNALETGEPVVTDLENAAQEGKHFVFLGVPVVSNADQFIMLGQMDSERLNNVLQQAGLPAEWIAGIVDRNGVFISRSRSPEKYVGKHARPEVIEVAKGNAIQGIFDNVTLEGIPVANTFRRSTLSGWVAVIAVPRTILDAPVALARTYIFLWGSLLALGAAISALLLAKRISRPLAALRIAAIRLAKGEPHQLQSYGLIELYEVSKALDQAGEYLKERDEARHSDIQKANLIAEIQQELQVRYDELDIIYRAAPVGLAFVDSQFRLVRANAAFASLTGVQLSSGIGRHLSEAMSAPVFEQIEEPLRRASRAMTLVTIEMEVVSKIGAVWCKFSAVPVLVHSKKLSGLDLVFVDMTEHKRQQERVQVLLLEVSHRSKNLLAVIQSIARQTVKNADPATFVEVFNARLASLASGQDLLVKEDWKGADLAQLIESQISHFTEWSKGRIERKGPPLLLRPIAVQAIGMAIHELATNAAKYGALSNDRGSINIEWWLLNENEIPTFKLQWKESDGPAVKLPKHLVFGSLVLSTLIETSLEGSASIAYCEGGLSWSISAPLRFVAYAGA